MLSAEAVNWFREGQHYFNDLVVAHLESIKQGHALAAYISLALVGFIYGVVHAVGPGHGKMVVSSYVLANENSLKRGLLVVALSSLLQAATAIILVLGFYYLLAATREEAEHAASLLEIASFVMIGGLGLWLMVQGLHTLGKAFGFSKHTHHHNHSHHHDHAHDDGCCGHAHVPMAEQLKNKKDIGSLALMTLSIGIRPCTGALLLLFFSCMFDLAWAGALATVAMAIGTAVTTGALALLAVKSKDVALSFVKKSDRGLLFIHAALRLGGGAIIVLTAVLFLATQMSGEAPVSPSQHPLYKSLH